MGNIKQISHNSPFKAKDFPNLIDSSCSSDGMSSREDITDFQPVINLPKNAYERKAQKVGSIDMIPRLNSIQS
jgi:hypothetical protein